MMIGQLAVGERQTGLFLALLVALVAAALGLAGRNDRLAHPGAPVLASPALV